MQLRALQLHVDWVLLWGSPESLREIKSLITMIETAQTQAAEKEKAAGGGSSNFAQ